MVAAQASPSPTPQGSLPFAPVVTPSGANAGFSKGERRLRGPDARPGTLVASSGTLIGDAGAAADAAAGAWARRCASGAPSATLAAIPADWSNSRLEMDALSSEGVFTSLAYSPRVVYDR